MKDAIVFRLRSIPSTQDLAKQMAVDGAPDWTVVVAERQTRGRGRLERVWQSAKGGLYLSLVLRPKALAPRSLPKLSLRCAAAVAAAARELTGARTKVKKPNDVLIRHGQGFKKVCGILIEASGDSSRTHWVVVGVGLNVNNRIAAALKAATSLSAVSGERLPLELVEAAVLGKLAEEVGAFA